MTTAAAHSSATAVHAVKGHHRQVTWTVLVARLPTRASATETRTTADGDGCQPPGPRADLTEPSSCPQPAMRRKMPYLPEESASTHQASWSRHADASRCGYPPLMNLRPVLASEHPSRTFAYSVPVSIESLINPLAVQPALDIGSRSRSRSCSDTSSESASLDAVVCCGLSAPDDSQLGACHEIE